MVSMGTELGGGALAWRRQQMWPVQGWLGGREGRAAPGGGALPATWQAWGGMRGRLQPPAHQPQAPHWARPATSLLPTRWARPWPASSRLGLGLLDGTHVG